MSETGEILHGVVLPNGAAANTIVPAQTIDNMYPVWRTEVSEGQYNGDVVLVDGMQFQPFNSTLRFTPLAEGSVVKEVQFGEGDVNRSLTDRVVGESVAITGNTVNRLCAVGKSCNATCFLAGVRLSVEDMASANCARANTAMAFERAEVLSAGKFMLLPTSKKVVLVGDYSLTPEYANSGSDLMQYRLPSGESAVFTEKWLKEKGLSEFAVAMNGADGSFGIATMEVAGERIFIAFCSMRPNMGDRDYSAQILRKAIDAHLDQRQVFNPDTRKRIIAGLKPSIFIGASATLRNFAHKIQIPEAGSKYYDELQSRYPELIAQANGEITPRIVLHDQYAGALDRGNIYRQSDAWLGVQSDPYSPSSCPLNGETCHVDYRAETEYTIRQQLVAMGINAGNIWYNDEYAMDPADPENLMASNRAEQNNGVATDKTNRTINGIVVIF